MGLTEAMVKAIKGTGKAERYTDRDGLYLRVTAAGSKTYYVRVRSNREDKAYPLGKCPDMKLAEARTAARQKKEELAALEKELRDPETNLPRLTFKQLVDEWVQANENVWRPSYIKSIWQRLNSIIFPAFGDTLINEITPMTVLSAVRVAEKRGAIEAARKALSMVGQIMRYAVASQYIAVDPTRDLRGALKKRVNGHFAAATTAQDAKTVVRAVRNYTGALSVKLALEFLMLTFVRPGNVRAAQWRDIDLEQRVWNIPAEQMKTGKPHQVPLSDQAMGILKQAWKLRREDGRVFPAVRTRCDRGLSDATLTSALRTAGIPQEMMTAHGFRSMASSLLNEAQENPDIIEKQLAHVSADRIRGIYNRTEYWDERVRLMQHWADMVDELAA